MMMQLQRFLCPGQGELSAVASPAEDSPCSDDPLGLGEFPEWTHRGDGVVSCDLNNKTSGCDCDCVIPLLSELNVASSPQSASHT